MNRLPRAQALLLIAISLAALNAGADPRPASGPGAKPADPSESVSGKSFSKFPGNRRYRVPDTKSDFVVYRDLGPRDARLTIVMLHGVANTKIMWKEAEARLGEFRTICLDLPGHGESTQDASRLPPRSGVPAGPYGLSAQGVFFRRFLSDLGLLERGKVVLAGCSYGGGIELEAYRLMTPAEREHVAGMFLLAPAAHACRKPERYELGEMIAAFLSTGLGEIVARLVVPPSPAVAWTGLKIMYHDLSKIDEPLLDEWIADDIAVLQRPRAAYFAVRTSIDIWDELTARSRDGTDERRYTCVKCPILVGWGTMDNVLDASILLQLKDEIPQLESRLFYGGRHDLLGLKDKTALRWLTEFVDKVKTAGKHP